MHRTSPAAGTAADRRHDLRPEHPLFVHRFDLHQVAEIQAEILGDNGIAERIRHANVVSFTCLKSFAYDQRFERKDAHDLIYCLEHAAEGLDAVAMAFQKRSGKHGASSRPLAILRSRFANDKQRLSCKDGPVSVARFELVKAMSLSSGEQDIAATTGLRRD